MNLKEQIVQDLQNVIFNPADFAVSVVVGYYGETLTFPAFFQDGGQTSNQNKFDKFGGIAHTDTVGLEFQKTLYYSLDSWGKIPKRNSRLVVNGEEFEVVKSTLNLGLVEVLLRREDE
jgi:hypothetical protein